VTPTQTVMGFEKLERGEEQGSRGIMSPSVRASESEFGSDHPMDRVRYPLPIKGLFGCDLTLGCLATDLGGGVYKLRFVSGLHQISRAEAPTNEFNLILFGGHLQPSRP